MTRPLQVGIIGASAQTGWARESHVPAVGGLAGLQLGAVVASSVASAQKAAAAFDIRAGYGDAEDLFRDATIDIVTVAVKVPEHHALVLGALRAGKHVYCEWPLSPTLRQAQELADAAERSGVRVALGLQARMNPAARAAAQLIADGAIGRVLGARCFSTSYAWGAKVEAGMVFAEDPAAGVNLVLIQGAHTVDLCIAVLGEIGDASAIAARQYPHPEVSGEDRRVQRKTFDHLLVQARLSDGGTLHAEIMGGRPTGQTPFQLEVTGETGALQLVGGAPRGFQSGTLSLQLNGRPYPVDAGELAGLPEAAINVAGIYTALRDDVTTGSSRAPDFAHAVRLTRLVDDLLDASGDGQRRRANDWPRRNSGRS